MSGALATGAGRGRRGRGDGVALLLGDAEGAVAVAAGDEQAAGFGGDGEQLAAADGRAADVEGCHSGVSCRAPIGTSEVGRRNPP